MCSWLGGGGGVGINWRSQDQGVVTPIPTVLTPATGIKIISNIFFGLDQGGVQSINGLDLD